MMRGHAKEWFGELIFLQMKSASPEKKRLLMEQFNASLGFRADSVREWKHVSGLQCPRCGANSDERIVCNGKVKPGNARQRYVCRDCGGSFNDNTGTVFHRTRMLEKWPTFLQCMLHGFSIRQSARELGISPTTAQAWRKKILAHLASQLSAELSGFVELEEMTVNPSNKGRKKGETGDETIAGEPQNPPGHTVVFCKSRKGEVYIGDMAGWEQVKKAQEGKMTVIRSSSSSRAPRADAKKQLRQAKQAAALAKLFRLNYARMRGVNARYLQQYAAWEQFRATTEGVLPKERLSRLLRFCL